MSGWIDMANADWKSLVPANGYPPDLMERMAWFVANNSPAELEGMQCTPTQLARLCGQASFDDHLVKVANYLVANGVFEIIYLFDDGTGQPSEVYSSQEIREARSDGMLAHPLTGEAVENFEEKLMPVFVFRQAK